MEVKPIHLVMVTNLNNNKYYDMIPNGDTIIVKYGRIDSTCTEITKPMSDWDKIYNSKIKKGYVDQSDLAQDLFTRVETKKDKEYLPIPNKVIADLVERLQRYANKAIEENYIGDSSKVTQAMVDKAQDAINELLYVNDVNSFNQHLLTLYSILPRKMANVADALVKTKAEFADKIKKEQDLLDVMRGKVFVASLPTPTNENEEYSNNCTILEALGIELEETDEKDVALIKKNLGDCADKYYASWRIHNKMAEERFTKYCKAHGIKKRGGVKLLWHGTRNENVWSILYQSLRNFRKSVKGGPVINGKMLGYGLYSSTIPKKSLNYTSFGYWTKGNASTGFMFLNEWALGKSYDIYAFNSKYYDFDYQKLKEVAPDCESLWAHKGMDTGWGSLKNDEIVVYNEDQVNLKYLVEVR